MQADKATTAPWWRHGMMWLVVGGPVTVIVAGIATLLIALAYPDPVLPTRELPATQARNHAAQGGAPAQAAAPRP